MLLRSLRLQNFRNYEYQELDLTPGLTALVGQNGQGKTNLLEALCVLATTRSPLCENDRELIRWGQHEAGIGATLELEQQRGDLRHLECRWRTAGSALTREMKVDGVPQSLLAQWLGQLQLVAFFPDDLALISGEPAGRRRFLNLELSKTGVAHFADTVRYRRVLQQRNALLKQMGHSRFRSHQGASSRHAGSHHGPGSHQAAAGPGVPPGTLAEWNRQLIAAGARILSERARFIVELQPLLRDVFSRLSGLPQKFTVHYQPGVKGIARARELQADDLLHDWPALISSSVEGDHQDDVRRGNTSSGPHRDELIFKLDDIDLRRYGSQGQQRLAVLALKLALAHWVTKTTGEPPVLLLDDALSELDETRRRLLLEEARTFPQTILTSTELIPRPPEATIWTVHQGHLSASV